MLVVFPAEERRAKTVCLLLFLPTSRPHATSDSHSLSLPARRQFQCHYDGARTASCDLASPSLVIQQPDINHIWHRFQISRFGQRNHNGEASRTTWPRGDDKGFTRMMNVTEQRTPRGQANAELRQYECKIMIMVSIVLNVNQQTG